MSGGGSEIMVEKKNGKLPPAILPGGDSVNRDVH